MILNVTDSTVETEISEGVVLLDVWAPWCGPCIRMHSVLQQADEVLGSKIKILRLNAETDMNFATKMGVKGIPAFFLYKNGSMVLNWVGYKTKDDIVKIINNYI